MRHPARRPAQALRRALGARRWLAAVALAAVSASAAAQPAPEPPAGAASAAATSAVQVEIDAPGPLRELLQTHLDLVRLGRITREQVDESEWSRLIAATPAQVRSLLQTEGYFEPEVQLERRRGTAAAEVLLRVRPGRRLQVSRATLQVEGELERGASDGRADAVRVLEQWRAAWPLAAGKEFRNPDWNDAKANALAQLRAAGYASAVWLGTGAEVDVPRAAVRLFLVVDSGPLYRYGSLQIEGLVAQDASTVENLLAAPRGAALTETLLLDFQDRLLKSGLFENANVTLELDPAQAAQARIVARVKEAPLQIYTFGVGVSANTGARASVEHVYRRVLGWPANSHVKIEVGERRQAWDAELSTQPRPGLHRWLLGGAVERLVSDNDVVLAQRLRAGRAQDKKAVERLHFVEAERSLRVTEAGLRTSTVALSANFHGVWRNLDSVLLPTRGVTLAVQLGAGYSNSNSAPNGSFTRAYGRVTGYLPLGQAWYGQARLELGQVFVRSEVRVPDSQKWRAGGDDSVRGYGYRSLGPLVDGAVGGGAALATASVELARPFSAELPALWGAVFVDAGNAADRFGDLRPALGLGAGVRWRSPVGPLKLDYAWGRDTRRSRLHFSVGIAF